VVVVLSNGSPIEMPWAHDISAILEGYLGGQAGAGALADILSGKVNPSGKLAESFPLKLEDNPSYHYFPGGPATVEYRESIYVGYRYYDTVNQEVRFPFGHGLSYTTFEYSDLNLSQSQITYSDMLTVTLKVKNTGSVTGKEIVQLYVKDVESTVFRPEKELKGFAKVELAPGEETRVTIELNWRAFAYYNTDLNDWHVETGIFQILAGASSGDIRLDKTVEVISTGPETLASNQDPLSAYYNFPKGVPISQKEFEVLLGKPVPPNPEPKKGDYTLNTPVGDMQDSFFGRQLLAVMNKQMAKMIAGQEDTPMELLMNAAIQEMPLRGMLMSGDGSLTREMLEALLDMINGKIFKGISGMLKAILTK
jgi:beta-glucosidase